MSLRARLARTLRRIRRAVTPSRANRARVDHHAARVAAAFKRKPPAVKDTVCSEHECGKAGWSGRYDPATHTVHRAMEKRMPRARRKALKGHEIAHGMVCERGTPGCTYKGEHSPRYYRTLKKVHRKIGTDPKEAVELERLSGYRPPKSFARGLGKRKAAR